MKLINYLIALALLISLIALVNAADCYLFERSISVDFYAPAGKTIVSVYLNNIQLSEDWAIQNVLLDAYGKVYQLEIKGRNEGDFGAWKHFYINLTHPNGTAESKELQILQALAFDYDVKIQYYVIQADIITDIDIYIVLDPLDTTLNAPSATYTIADYLNFSRVQYSSNREADVEIYVLGKEEWIEIQKEWEEEDIWAMLEGMFKEQLPYIGEAVEFFEATYSITAASMYYFQLVFIDNGLLTFTLFESFVIVYSASARNIFRFGKRYINAHLALFNAMLYVIRTIIDIFYKIIQAIKPW